MRRLVVLTTRVSTVIAFLTAHGIMTRPATRPEPADLPPGITELLDAWSTADHEAFDTLIPLVERELRGLAHHYLRAEPTDPLLQTTVLVNELYLRLAQRRRVSWENRAQFFGFAARTMRRILVDQARRRRADKRGAGQADLPLDAGGFAPPREHRIVALDEALEALARLDPRQARIVELRFFAGLNHHEIADLVGLSERSVRRLWRSAQLWLYRELSGAEA